MTTAAKPVVPEVAWLNVNRDCNLRCKWCYAQGAGYGVGKNMTLEFAKDMAVILKEMHIKKIILLGGEPTLWEPLIDFNRFCGELGMSTSLVTNAIQFGVDTYWEAYQQHPNTHAPWVSMKAYDQRSLERTCGAVDLDMVSLGIKRATEFFDCGVSFVYNSCFTDNLIDMTRSAVKMGARSVRICPCTPTFADDTASDHYMIETQLYIANVIRDYQELSDITGGKLCFSMKMPLCLWPKEFLDILIRRKQMTCTCQVQKRAGIMFDPGGNLLMCNLLFDYPMGTYGKDFSDCDSLVAYLNSDKVLGYYDRMNAYPSTKCIGCKKFNICSGGCPLRWAVYKPEETIQGLN
jgi:radical SAM protein with 4Fe4S-binding SPASM domain